MSRVELVVPERDVVPVTEALASSGVFHLADSDYMCLEDGTCQTDEWHRWSVAFSTLERRILAVMEALGVDEGEPPPETPHLIGPEVAELDIQHLEQEAQAPVRELEEEQRRLERLQYYVAQLEPISDLEVNLGALRDLRYLFVMLGTMPSANIERLRSSLEHVPFALVPVRRMEHLATVVLFGLQRDAEILSRAARSAYLNPLTPPETYRGTPAEAIAALHAGIQRTQRHIAEYRASIEHLREMRIHHLRHLLWRVRASHTLADTIARYGRLRYTYLVSGWVPTALMPRLRDSISHASDQVLVEISPPREAEEANIPVALNNPSFLRPFQGLVTNYGQPRYGELDPTPILALTFPLVFGIMFGDIGHGVLLALVGLLLSSRRVRLLRGLAGLGPVLIACGIAATVFGFLYGSIFGLETVLDAVWIRPLENILDILIATIAIGALLLSLGIVYNIANAALARRWGEMLFARNGLAGLVFYWSLLGLAATAFVENPPLASDVLFGLMAISGLMVAFSELLARLLEGHRPLVEESIGTYVMQALFELFETVIGLLSNTLSYVRMGAFAVAHGGLSLVVFILADIFSPARGPLYWMIVALGNLFVVGFEGLIVGIQTLRLEYYEFFSKFFSGSGLRHRPLTLIAREEK
jgi:V/A-type H+-transporting ATPase subunit I